MRANQIAPNTILKRNKSGFIIPTILAFIYFVIIFVLTTVQFRIEFEMIRTTIVLILAFFLLMCLGAAYSHFDQPSKISITEDKVIIGKGKLVFDGEDVDIKIHSNKFDLNKIWILIFMGPLPGLLYILSRGINNIVFTHNLNKYTLSYISEKNIRILCKSLKLDSNPTSDELIWLNKTSNWEKGRDTRKVYNRFFAILLSLNIILIVLVRVGVYYIPKVNLNYASGLGTENSPYIISSPEELEYFAEEVNNSKYVKDIYFALGADIDLSGKTWTPIGINNNVFISNFDGRGHVIRNYKIEGAIPYAGLFARNGGTIKNLGMENSIVNIFGVNSPIAGTLVGINGGLIENCYAINGSIDINRGAIAGGLIGENSGNVINSYAIIDVSIIATGGTVAGGGFIGWNIGDGVGINSLAAGNVYVSTKVSGIEHCQGAGFSANNDRGYNTYSYEGQLITRVYASKILDGPSITTAKVCTLKQLNDKDFYITTLRWSEEVWDLSNLDFENGNYPELRVNKK